MNSVERMVHYAWLPEEGVIVDKTRRVPPSWPSAGAVKFYNVDFAYRPGLPLVLKGVSFTIKPGEKVGIVGRTGAGKSSLLQAIFRHAVMCNRVRMFLTRRTGWQKCKADQSRSMT
jgi:ATP-binding cassette subfamily C (CFTR/MRP) protein 1